MTPTRETRNVATRELRNQLRTLLKEIAGGDPFAPFAPALANRLGTTRQCVSAWVSRGSIPGSRIDDLMAIYDGPIDRWHALHNELKKYASAQRGD